MMLLLLGALVAATPFTDEQSRFSLSLPDGWSVAPRVAASDGVAFRRQVDNLFALILVNVMPAEAGLSLHKIAADSGRVVAGTPGYRLVADGVSKLGALPAFRRRYVQLMTADGRWQKMCEDRWAVGQGRIYLVHAETVAESFGTFEQDFEMLFASFGMPTAAAAAAGDLLLDSPVVGRWMMAGTTDTQLDLRADGTFSLLNLQGTYTVEGAVLHMRPSGAAEESYRWRRTGKDLVLESAALGKPIVYHSVKVAGPATNTKRDQAQP